MKNSLDRLEKLLHESDKIMNDIFGKDPRFKVGGIQVVMSNIAESLSIVDDLKGWC